MNETIVLEDVIDDEMVEKNYNEQVCEESTLNKPIVTIIKRNKTKINTHHQNSTNEQKQINIPSSEDIKCDKCNKKFSKLDELSLHQAFHTEEYNCNFCNRSFKSLQYLRKHNTSCSKGKNNEMNLLKLLCISLYNFS